MTPPKKLPGDLLCGADLEAVSLYPSKTRAPGLTPGWEYVQLSVKVLIVGAWEHGFLSPSLSLWCWPWLVLTLKYIPREQKGLQVLSEATMVTALSVFQEPQRDTQVLWRRVA